MKCPACNSSKVSSVAVQVHECRRCDAVFGSCYRGDLYQYVVPVFDTVPDVPPEETRYFDFKVLGSDGVSRVHGWLNRSTRRVVQFG